MKAMQKCTTKSERTKAILETTRKVVTRQGFRKTTLDDIARELGMTTPALYHYFSNKNELMRMLAKEVYEKNTEILDGILNKSMQPDEKLRELIRTMVLDALDKARGNQISRSEFAEIMEIVEDIQLEFDEKLRACVRSILNQGIRAGVFDVKSVEVVVNTFCLGIKGFFAEVVMVGERERDEIFGDGIDNMLTLFMNGIRAR
ncbi:MAG: hypothetical protein DRH50_09785 [Deltaproteobacteria bacterium]|nr:MAG: hypothetical protein DRH50_09785 [Deltaproteobacteria bacterium]